MNKVHNEKIFKYQQANDLLKLIHRYPQFVKDLYQVIRHLSTGYAPQLANVSLAKRNHCVNLTSTARHDALSGNGDSIKFEPRDLCPGRSRQDNGGPRVTSSIFGCDRISAPFIVGDRSGG
ncbi:MAG: hypothetical protein ACI9FB_002389 [Candidatus Azotimanducaceae bacterium]|jgi:hypothetical protein